MGRFGIYLNFCVKVFMSITVFLLALFLNFAPEASASLPSC